MDPRRGALDCAGGPEGCVARSIFLSSSVILVLLRLMGLLVNCQIVNLLRCLLHSAFAGNHRPRTLKKNENIQKERLALHVIPSICMRLSKFTSLLPETCHIPVMPGLAESTIFTNSLVWGYFFCCSLSSSG